ncbi:MAG: fructosamine kinase family protein [Anaerolineales bacterium]|nr:fructosamine kinase family protein [Anaerolineales bacterium]
MLPPALEKAVRAQFNIQSVQPCSGGDISQADRLVTADGPLFIKWHPRSPQGMFSAEAKGLAVLAQAKALRVPQVIYIQEPDGPIPAYLILEWLEPGHTQNHTDEELGHGLAVLHQHTADHHGLDHSNYIGSLPQTNQPSALWADFYAHQRIMPQMAIARRNGELPSHRENLLNKLLAQLPRLLPNDNPPASLLHGDLWCGNVMTLTNGQPAIIDPAVYYGHREVEMAFTELFGGFSSHFYAAYNEAYPLPQGYAERRLLYQLYPLMVHMNLFGGGYGSRVDAILRHYVGS